MWEASASLVAVSLLNNRLTLVIHFHQKTKRNQHQHVILTKQVPLLYAYLQIICFKNYPFRFRNTPFATTAEKTRSDNELSYLTAYRKNVIIKCVFEFKNETHPRQIFLNKNNLKTVPRCNCLRVRNFSNPSVNNIKKATQKCKPNNR